MSGVGWDQRKDGDWLASNGRWYPGNTRPRGWDRTALPPAPDHKAARGSALDAVRSRFEDAAGPRRTAEATVVDQRSHSSRLPAGSPPMPAIGAPPPPGRVRDDAPEMPPPAERNLPAPPPPAPTSVVAGDLGRVVGSARAKIEKRIEDAIEQVDGR